MHHRLLSGLCLVALISAWPTVVTAESPTLRGFATLGVVHNPDDFDFVRGLDQPRGARDGWSARPDTTLGLQLNWSPDERWDLVLQAVSRYYYDDYRPRITQAFAKFRPTPAWTLRAGRLGYDVYLNSDSRHVGYAHLPVRNPIEYFGILELAFIDGVDLVYRTPAGGGLFSAKVFGGWADEKRVASTGELYDVGGSLALGGYLHYRLGDWQLRGGVSDVKLENRFAGISDLQAFLRALGNPTADRLAANLPLRNRRITNWSLETAWNGGDWDLKLRLNHRESETRSLPDGFSLEALAGYRLGNLTPYLGYVLSDTRNVNRLDSLPGNHPAQLALRPTTFEQESYIAGLRLDLHENLAVKLQVDHVRAPDPLGGFFSVDEAGWNGHGTLLSATLEVLF